MKNLKLNENNLLIKSHSFRRLNSIESQEMIWLNNYDV